MASLDYKFIKSFKELKEKLKPIIDENYDWLKPIINSTLDKDVLSFLAINSPVTTAYYTLDLSEHITQLTDIINKNIRLRSEIFEIEAIAINTALELIQASDILESDSDIGELAIKANLSLTENLEEDKYFQANIKKTENIKFKIYTKLYMHNQVGNPLNYGERTLVLRNMYCENLKIIYERLIATKRTLIYSYKIDTVPLPNFLDASNNLDLIVNWVRDALYKFEIGQQSNTIIQRSVALTNCSYSKSTGKDLINDLKIDRSYVSFKIEHEDIESLRRFNSVRVIGFSINIIENYIALTDGNNGTETANKINQETLKEKTFYAVKTIIPKQDIGLNLGEIYEHFDENDENVIVKLEDIKPLNPFLMGRKIIGIGPHGRLIFEEIPIPKEQILFPNNLSIYDIKPIYKTSVVENLNFNPNNHFKNISPFGEWALVVENVSFDNTQRALGLANIKDIVLTFKLAIN